MSAGRSSNPSADLAARAFAEIAASVVDLVDGFMAADHRLFLVGGAVRDVFVASELADSHAAAPEVDLTDLDFTTAAHPEEIIRLVRPHASAVWTQGERFGTIGATIDGRLVEITTHRAESYDEASRKPVVTFGKTLEADLARRDFTINALAVSLPECDVVDPFDGRSDLVAGILRTPLAPEVSFSDDPLRMLRAARFLARFGLDPAPELVRAAADGAGRLAIVSAERVQAELEKLFSVENPEPALAFLDETGLLAEVLPELVSISEPDRAEAQALAGSPGSPLVRRAGLLLPIAASARGALARLRYSRADSVDTVRLLDAVDIAIGGVATDRDVRVVVDSIGLDRCADLIQLNANVRSHRRLVGEGHFVEALQRLGDREDLADLDSPVSGGELITKLGLEPGPLVGQAV
ncbi:MAG: CCA tRNA nucleotidyltransferase, partial [Acidimicrobiales bacterium]